MANDDTDELTPHERIEAMFKSPYDTEGEVWNALIHAFAQEFEGLEETLDDINTEKFVETASPQALERLASIVDVERRTNVEGEPKESIDAFRARIKVALRSQTTSATIPEIIEIVSLVLNQEPETIDVKEPFNAIPTEIQLVGIEDAVADLDMTDGEFVGIIEQVLASGVAIGILLEFDFDEEVTVGDPFHEQIEEVETAYVAGSPDNPDARSNIDLTNLTETIETIEASDIEIQTDNLFSETTDAITGVWNFGGINAIDASDRYADLSDSRYDDHNLTEADLDFRQAQLFESNNEDTLTQQDISHEQIEEVLKSVVEAGRAQVDTNTDGVNPGWESEDGDTQTDEQVHIDTSDVHVDGLEPVYVDEGAYEIDVVQLLGAIEEFTEWESSTQDDLVASTATEVLVAASGHGVGQIDVTDDGSTVRWDAPAEISSESASVSDDTAHNEVSDLDVVYVDNGQYGIDVVQLLSSAESQTQTDSPRTTETTSVQTDETLVATIGAGRSQVDSTDDGSTPKNGFSALDGDTQVDVQYQSESQGLHSDSVSVAYVEDGIFEVEVWNETESAETLTEGQTQETGDNQQTTVEEVQLATVDTARTQVDTNTDGVDDGSDTIAETLTESSDQRAGQTQFVDTNRVLTAAYNYGAANIDLYYDGNLRSRWSKPKDGGTEISPQYQSETVSETIEQVTTAFANEGRTQVDLSTLTESIAELVESDSPRHGDVSFNDSTEVLVGAYGASALNIDVYYQSGLSTRLIQRDAVGDTNEDQAQSEVTQTQIEQVSTAYTSGSADSGDGRANIDVARG